LYTLAIHGAATFEATKRHEKCRWGLVWSSTRYSFLLNGIFFMLGIFVLLFFFLDIWQDGVTLSIKLVDTLLENSSCFGKVTWLHSAGFVLLYTTISAFSMFYKLVSEHRTSNSENSTLLQTERCLHYALFARSIKMWA
jgi:hypothetical protein